MAIDQGPGGKSTVSVTCGSRVVKTHRFSSVALVQIRRSAVGNSESSGSMRRFDICLALSSFEYTRAILALDLGK
jgi:hypothetical protein